MLIITFMKPNVIIDSDTMISGKIKIYDKAKHELRTLSVINKSFISIKTLSYWPKELEIEIDTGDQKFNKEILT